ncbi:hypothetical protein MHYP_G00064620 [Metynnis hypsauchen]
MSAWQHLSLSHSSSLCGSSPFLLQQSSERRKNTAKLAEFKQPFRPPHQAKPPPPPQPHAVQHYEQRTSHAAVLWSEISSLAESTAVVQYLTDPFKPQDGAFGLQMWSRCSNAWIRRTECAAECTALGNTNQKLKGFWPQSARSRNQTCQQDFEQTFVSSIV